jgi:hypothetical protein
MLSAVRGVACRQGVEGDLFEYCVSALVASGSIELQLIERDVEIPARRD